MVHQEDVQVNADRYIYESWGILRMPEPRLGKCLRPKMHYEVVLCPHILPKSCSKAKASALSQDLLESCIWFSRPVILPLLSQQSLIQPSSGANMAVRNMDNYLWFHIQRADLTMACLLATLCGRGGLLKTIHHMDPLQDPLFWSKGQGKAKSYSKSRSWEKPIGKAWKEFYSLSQFHFSNVGLSCLLPNFWRKVTERPLTCLGRIYRHSYGVFCLEFLA